MTENQAHAKSFACRKLGGADWPAIKELSREMARRGGRMTAQEVGDIMRRHKRPRPDSPHEVAQLVMLSSAVAANERRETRTRRPEEHRRRTVDPRKVRDWSKVPYRSLPPLSDPDGEWARRRWLAAQRL